MNEVPERPLVIPAGLEAIVGSVRGKGPAPVERWNPPYCGDIGLEIRADGSWWYQGTPIGRRAMVELFASVLRKDADGATYLVTPVEKVRVAVADAPFLAVEMEVRGEGQAQSIAVRTNLDEWVQVGSEHPLRFEPQLTSGGLKPYVMVRGRLEALMVRSVYLELVGLAEPRDGCGLGLGVWAGGRWWPMADSAS